METALEADEKWMRIALAEAGRAREAGEVPVGAVIVRDGDLLASARNSPISLHDPSAHAEILAIRAAAAVVGNYRLAGDDALRDARTLPHVRRRDPPCPDRTARLRRRRSQGGRGGLPLPALRGPASEPRRRRHGGDPPGGVRRNFEWIFSGKEANDCRRNMDRKGGYRPPSPPQPGLRKKRPPAEPGERVHGLRTAEGIRSRGGKIPLRRMKELPISGEIPKWS